MFGTILLIFFTVFVVEIGDKTQLSMILLSSKTKKHFTLLLGVLAAFFLIEGFSVLFASFLVKYVSYKYIKFLSGIIFILFGFLSLTGKEDKNTDTDKIVAENPFFMGFSLTALAEIGDKSQIAMALFATKYPPLLVFIVGMASLVLMAVLTIYAGKYICTRIHESVIIKISAILFIFVGIFFLF